MVSEIHSEMTTINTTTATTTTSEEHYGIKKIKKAAVRSSISSEVIFAISVGYLDRAYHGFYVTSCVIY